MVDGLEAALVALLISGSQLYFEQDHKKVHNNIGEYKAAKDLQKDKGLPFSLPANKDLILSYGFTSLTLFSGLDSTTRFKPYPAGRLK